MWTEKAYHRNRRAEALRARRQARERCAGVALLTALALLMIFVTVGLFYIRYMELENERTDLDLREVRARHAASAGVYAALAEIKNALASGRAPGAQLEFELPVYGPQRGSPLGFAPMDTRRAVARVTVSDESGKVNLNHATAPVLRSLFGFDEAAAAKIVAGLPDARNPEASWSGGGDRTWLISLDDMVARGMATRAAADAIDPSVVTFSSVADHAAPAQYLNVNVASVWVIATTLGVNPETAQAVGAARPFKALAELAAVAGKDPATFNLPPEAFGFTSRCYRVVSEGAYSNVVAGARDYRTSRYRVEAVVVFDAAGVPKMTLWSEGFPGDDRESGGGKGVRPAAEAKPAAT
jgi:DNA uptake protein ComE-like DNA-binding protein